MLRIPDPPPNLNPLTITADQFITFMESTWGDIAFEEDGLVGWFGRDYDTYHNARLTALSLQAKHSGNTVFFCEDGKQWGEVLQFPSGARISVSRDGSQLRPGRRRNPWPAQYPQII